MNKKKVCMLGAFAVGKTSLVGQFVHSKYEDKYLTTVGVKIDEKQVNVDGQDVKLMLWDMAGEDELMKVKMSYLRGAAGYLLVVDGTRRATVEVARSLRQRVEDEIGKLPLLVVANKYDLTDDWDVVDADLEALAEDSCGLLKTSAKTGEGVEDAFITLARHVLA